MSDVEILEPERCGCILESTCSRLKAAGDIWIDACILNASLSGSVIISLGRAASADRNRNAMIIDDLRVSSQQFTIVLSHVPGKMWVFTLFDTSRNGTWVNGVLVHNSSGRLHHGDEIVVLPSNRVHLSEVVSLRFRYSCPAPVEENPCDIPAPPQVSLGTQLSEEMSCGICSEVLFKPLSVMPCLHNFCSVCFLEWAVARTKVVICPICRADIQGVQPNHQLRSIIATFLTNRPDKGYSPSELMELHERETKLRANVKKSEGMSWCDIDNRTSNAPRRSVACVIA